ncbi:MAG: 30S ribosomal protein S3ae [Thermoplasmata archaeon]
MARRKSRRASRRVKDKWKSKRWYSIVAPDMFKGAKVGETPSADPELLLGRISEISLQDLAGDFSKVHVKVKLRINSIRGGECRTQFHGHGMTSDFVRRLTRRRRSKINPAFDVTTKEGYEIRIKVLSVTNKRINSSIKRSLRNKQMEIISETASKSSLSQLVQKMLFGSLASQIKKECKTIYPLRTVEICKSKILSVPEGEQVEDLILTQEEVEEESAVEEEEPTPETDKTLSKPEVLEEFQKIDGVGPTMAEKLYDGGFRDIEQLKDASEEDLKRVEGVGPAFSKKIQKALSEKD